MTEDQAREVLRTLTTAWPHIYDWLNADARESPQETLRMWLRMIGDIDYDIAKTALGMWMKGRYEVPVKPWEISILPQNFRAVCAKIADELARTRREEEVAKLTLQRSDGTQAGNLRLCMQISVIAGGMARDGHLSHDRSRQIGKQMGAIARDAEAMVPIPPEVRDQVDAYLRDRPTLRRYVAGDYGGLITTTPEPYNATA